MKKALLFSVIFFVSALAVLAYETIIIDFPDEENWVKAYYKKAGDEAILQYTPNGETSDNWVRSIVIHSYNNLGYPVRIFSNNNIMKMQKANPTAPYRTLKMSENEALFTRCTDDYENKKRSNQGYPYVVKGQCEFYRVTMAHNRIVTVHYMNKNKENFKTNYTIWLEIIRKARFLNSYWRNERTLNKSEFFEL